MSGAEYVAIVPATRGNTCTSSLLWLSVQWLRLFCRCVADAHLCGKLCKFAGRYGCQDVCAQVCAFVRDAVLTLTKTKMIDHTDEEHLCAAPVHACGKVSRR